MQRECDEGAEPEFLRDLPPVLEIRVGSDIGHLDHAALRHRFGGKLGIDATEKNEMDDIVQAWPEEIVMNDDVRLVEVRNWIDRLVLPALRA